MTGEEILKFFLKEVHNHFGLGIPDYDDLVDIDGIDVGIDTISVMLGPNTSAFIENFKEVNVGPDYLDNAFVPAIDQHVLDFNNVAFLKRHRAFSFSDSEFGFLSFKKLFETNPLSDLHSQQTDFKVVLDYISNALSNGNVSEVTSLLDNIESQNIEIGILVEWTVSPSTLLSTYSYIYYQELLSGRTIKLDSVLDYNLSHGAVTSFGHAINYEQYFEIFDIVNELNHAKDLLTRYLKLYHIIEYLMYRLRLVKIEVKARTNRTFIREIHSLIGQKTNEKEMLMNYLDEVFLTELTTNYFDLGALTQDQCDFFFNNWGVKYNKTTRKINSESKLAIASLIYGIRNSIVHNKESEFHLTTSNPAEYSIVIPVIKIFMQKLEKATLDKISANIPKLSYGSPNIQLF